MLKAYNFITYPLKAGGRKNDLMALVGCADEISRTRVFGWVMDTGNPAKSIEIRVLVDSVEVARGVADLVRPGLKEYLGGEATGAYEFDIPYPERLSVFRPYMVEVLAEGYDEPIPDGCRILTVPATLPSPLKPLMVTSTGRSGTTLLMRELLRHRQVVVADRYPYEIKLIAYYTAAYEALVSEADRVESTDPNEMFGEIPGKTIGHNPYYIRGLYSVVKNSHLMEKLFERSIPERIYRLFRRTIVNYYALVRNDQEKKQAVYFAEKGDLDEGARQGVRLFFNDIREIVMVRDPRDLLCSAKAFWQQTSKQSFIKLRKTLPELQKIRQSCGRDTLFIRYEDLISDAVVTRKIITQFLDIDDLSVKKSNDHEELFLAHATSADPSSSIERWRKDLTQQEIEDCDRYFGSYMDTFGYRRNAPEERKLSPILLFEGDKAVARLGADLVVADGRIFDRLQTVAFQATEETQDHLVTGWHKPEDGFVWTDGFESTVAIDRPQAKGHYRLRIVGRSFVHADRLPWQRIGLFVNDRFLGEIRCSEFAVIECDLPWNFISKARRIAVTLKCFDAASPHRFDPSSDDDRVLGFSLEGLAVFGARATPSRTASSRYAAAAGYATVEDIPLHELMLGFESLGENCEFGLVQRHCNIDPLGLFRFSSAPLPKLMNGLRAGFENMGKPGSIEVQVSDNGREYMVLDKCFGFLYHAWVLVGERTPKEVEARELKRLPLLTRKLIEEMRLGDKILVVRGMSPLTIEEVKELLAVIRDYGPAVLLWVELSDENHAPGTVEEIEPGLLKGYMDRFAPGENAHDLSLSCWIAVCRNAYRLWKPPSAVA